MTFTEDSFDDTTPLALRAVSFIAVILLWSILTPISLFYGIKFWILRQCQVLKKRYSLIASLEIVFVLIGLFTNGAIILADCIQSLWLRQTAFHISILLQYSIMYCWLWRFWLIYYDMRWLASSLTVEWRVLINPRSRSHSPSIGETDWFLDNRNTYGNSRWVGRKIAIFVVIISLITVALRYGCDFTHCEPIGETVYLFFYFVPFLVLGILRCRLPAFTDSIYIAQEMKYIILILLFAVIAFGIQEIAVDRFPTINTPQIIINLLFYVAIELCNFLCIMITTRYVLRKVSVLLTEQMHMQQPHDINASAEADYVAMDSQGETFSNGESQANLNAQLLQCLSNEKSFELFMRFLAKEFSIECLLVFVEMIQFKQYMKRRMELKTTEENMRETIDEVMNDSDVDIVFPATVPNSDIVHNEIGDTSIKAKMYKLYIKYIEKNSEFEINILDSTRKQLTKQVGNYHDWMNNEFDEVELYHFYDACIAEMRRLLIASYNRFRQVHGDDLLDIFIAMN